MSETKDGILTKAAANDETSFASSFCFRLYPLPSQMVQCCSSTAVHTRFVSGWTCTWFTLLRFIVINREKLGMLDRQGHVSGDVAYASWPASCQTSSTCSMAVQFRQAYRAPYAQVLLCSRLFVTFMFTLPFLLMFDFVRFSQV